MFWLFDGLDPVRRERVGLGRDGTKCFIISHHWMMLLQEEMGGRRKHFSFSLWEYSNLRALGPSRVWRSLHVHVRGLDVMKNVFKLFTALIVEKLHSNDWKQKKHPTIKFKAVHARGKVPPLISSLGRMCSFFTCSLIAFPHFLLPLLLHLFILPFFTFSLSLALCKLEAIFHPDWLTRVHFSTQRKNERT